MTYENNYYEYQNDDTFILTDFSLEKPNRFIIFYKKTIRLILLLSIFLVTILFKTDTQNIVIIKPIIGHTLVYLSFLLFLLIMLERRNYFLYDIPTYIPLMCMLLYFSISAIFVPWQFRAAAVEELSRFYIYGFLYILITEIFNTKKTLLKTIIIILITSTIVVIYGIMQLADKDFINWGQKFNFALSTFGSKNFLAGFQNLTFPISLLLVIYSLYCFFDFFNKKTESDYNNTRFNLFRLIIHFINILFNIFLCYYHIYFTCVGRVKGSLIAYFIMLILLIFFIVKYMLLPRNSFKYFVVIIVVIILLFKMTPILKNNNLIKLNFLFRNESRKVIKTVMWDGALTAWRQNKLLGTGIGSFQLVFPYYRSSDYHIKGVSHNTRHPQNEYLEILMETGTIGLAFFIWFLFYHFKFLFKGIKSLGKKSKFWQIILTGLLLGQIGTLIHNITSINLRWTSTAFIFWTIMGISSAIVSHIGDDEKENEIYEFNKSVWYKRILAVVSFSTIFGILLFYMVMIYQADYQLHLGNILIGQKKWNQSIDSFITSIKKNPYLKSPYYKLGFVYLNKHDFKNAKIAYDNNMDLSPRYAQIHYNYGLLWLNLFNTTKVSRYFNNVLYEFELATSMENNTINNSRLADLYSNIGKSYNTLYRLRLAAHIVSNDPLYCDLKKQKEMKKNFYNNIAAIYLNKLNNLDKAAGYYRRIGRLYPDDYKYYYTLAKIQTQYEKYQDAIETYKRILRKSPTDYQANFKIGKIYEKYLNDNYEAFIYYYNCYIQMPQLSKLPNKEFIPTLESNINHIIGFLKVIRPNHKDKYIEITDAIAWGYHILNKDKKAKKEYNKIKNNSNLTDPIKKHIFTIK